MEGFHPFYLTTDAAGGGSAPYTAGVTGAPASGSQTVTFVVPAGAPDVLWYQCINHAFMGYRMNVVGASTGEGGAADYALRPLSANPGRGEVRVAVTLPASAPATVEAFAADGRRVAVLHDGALAGGTPQPLAFTRAGWPRASTSSRCARARGRPGRPSRSSGDGGVGQEGGALSTPYASSPPSGSSAAFCANASTRRV